MSSQLRDWFGPNLADYPRDGHPACESCEDYAECEDVECVRTRQYDRELRDRGAA